MVIPIWKWEFATALQKSGNIPFANERLQMGQKWMFINWASFDGGPLQIPLR